MTRWLPALLFLFAALSTAVVVTAGSSMSAAIQRTDDSLHAIAIDLADAERLHALRERTSRKARTYLLTGDERFLRESREAESELFGLLPRIRSRLADPAVAALVERIGVLEQTRAGVFERILAAHTPGAPTAALGDDLVKLLQPVADALDEAINELLRLRRAAHDRAASDPGEGGASALLWAAAGAALGVAALSSLLLKRTLSRIVGTAEERLRHERDRFFDLSLDLVCIGGTDGYFKQLNPAFEATLGYSRAELLARPLLDFVHPDDRAATIAEIEKLARGELTIGFENRYVCKDGSHRWLSWRCTPEPSGRLYAVARDVTESREAHAQLERMAEELRLLAVVDELTGLHNRRGFYLLAGQQMLRAERERRPVVFFFADLDGLKLINDQLGHEAGDLALRDAADVFRASFRASDIIARLGGDEFAVLAVDAAADSADAFLARVEAAARSHAGTRPFTLAISVGSTLYDPAARETLDAVLARADALMYEQKALRKQRRA